jgi:hypothetical protein
MTIFFSTLHDLICNKCNKKGMIPNSSQYHFTQKLVRVIQAMCPYSQFVLILATSSSHLIFFSTVTSKQRYSVPDPRRFDTEPDPYRWINVPDPDPGIFFSGFQDANKQ